MTGALVSIIWLCGIVMAALLLRDGPISLRTLASDFLYGWNAALVILAKDSAQAAPLPNWILGIIILALGAGMIWGKMAKR